MKIPELTVSQMREVDHLMAEEYGIAVSQMMELAGYVTARVAVDLFSPKKVLVLVGKGHNGGDGLVAARHLRNFGVGVSVALAGEIHKELPLRHLETLRKIGIPTEDDPEHVHDIETDLVVDSLLGYSSKGEPRGGVALLIKEARMIGCPVLSADIPSGLEASTGKWFSPGFEESTCLTFGLPKKGMIRDPRIPRLLVGDIGIPKEVYERVGVKVPEMFRDWMYVDAKEHAGSQGKPKSL